MAADREVICAKWEQKYFCNGVWTGKPPICPSGKIAGSSRFNKPCGTPFHKGEIHLDGSDLYFSDY
jgi:hypothetical protein